MLSPVFKVWKLLPQQAKLIEQIIYSFSHLFHVLICSLFIPVAMTRYALQEYKPVEYEAIFLNRPYFDVLYKYGNTVC